MTSDATTREVLDANARLLRAIAAADWHVYAELCDPTLTSFEPEAMGQQVEGLDFHLFYFRLGGATGERATTVAAPRVRVMGDVAVVSYVRLNQSLVDGAPVTRAFEETRVWQRREGAWKLVHFHRSPATRTS